LHYKKENQKSGSSSSQAELAFAQKQLDVLNSNKQHDAANIISINKAPQLQRNDPKIPSKTITKVCHRPTHDFLHRLLSLSRLAIPPPLLLCPPYKTTRTRVLYSTLNGVAEAMEYYKEMHGEGENVNMGRTLKLAH